VKDRMSYLKVLYLPNNIASMPSITAEAINRIENTKAVYITREIHHYQSLTGSYVYLPQNVSLRQPLKWISNKLFYKRKLSRWIKWADVVHYFWSSVYESGEDLQQAYQLNKPIFIEWLGSDIRNPVLLQKINSQYKEALRSGYEYASLESEENSINAQKLFSKYRAVPLLCPEMTIYLQKQLFSEFHLMFQRINVKDFDPAFPGRETKRPLVVHSPSAKVAKGTGYILAAVKKLQQQYEFEFKLLHNIPRSEVLANFRNADIVIDQLIIGGYGMAAMEAMSFGKPVMSCIMPQVFEAGLPASCPVVNVNPENIEMKLAELLANPSLRNDIGKRSREYVMQYHDADKLAQDLLKLYRDALATKKNVSSKN
jgi:glycosyltransferase involved in cell wall biosynthesis